ncbi:MAG: hypothetical protein KDI19_08630, partial [Pseudomonadales bacterium]|nr:hypothetical protein [Pseudomonadales bacterium]
FPDLIQFYGMELNSPGADHSSLIMPQTSDEALRLRKLESEFDRAEAWPIDPARNEPARMLDALREMETFASKPVIIANHPSRSATGKGKWGLDEPSELRDWNDAAPDIAVGMAGAPGHQAAELSTHKPRRRGAYERSPTMGGFDQMTATLGGFWDSMLGEGRAWWITANSDSHRHYDEGGIDFWPGEYSKTWVFAKRTHASILEALRAGHIFVSTGDLIDRMDFVAATSGKHATIGETLVVRPGTVVHILLRVRDPAAQNAGGEDPVVTRIDLIRGDLTGVAIDRSSARNPTTRIEARYTAQDWQVDGDNLTVETSIEIDHSMYLRVRGTNTDQLEPEDDVPGENPWHDLWFYSNPIFVKVAQDS